MDLNLYLGLPHSPRPPSLESDSDLSLSSMPLLASETASSMEMEASVSQPARSPSLAFSEAPSFDPIAPCCLGHEPYGPIILYSPSNVQVLQTDQVFAEMPERIWDYDALIDDIFERLHFIDDNFAPERRDHFATAELVASESSEKEAEEKNRHATNYFDCNICIDIAKDPVVTPCGHLFCWACLYQWLHVHSDCKECPVCNRDVIEANITPTYGHGRGSSRSDIENNDEENINSASGLSIPPRPRGKRIESWSQILNRILERFGEGIADSSSFNERDLGQFVSIPIAGTRRAAHQASANSSTVEEPNRAYRRTQGSISSGSSDGGGSIGACKRRRLH